MIGGDGNGWAITLADLSIILFMLAAADLSNAETARPAVPAAPALIATSEPIAVYRPGADVPALGTWLATQPNDPRQQLTITVRHDGTSDAAVAEGLALASEAKAAGRPARLIVEQSPVTDITATLAYDSDPAAVARKLLEAEQRKPTPNPTEDIR